MNYGLVLLEICAIFASYLILFMPISFATNVNIYFGGYEQAEVDLDPNNEVLASVTTNSVDNTVTVSVKNKTSRQISQVVIYKCKDNDPATCVSTITPEANSGNLVKAYDWSELADTGSGYPQTGYLIIVIELEGTTSTWYGYRYRIRKYNANSFDPVYSWNMNDINVYAKTSPMVSKIRDFILANGMIPFNTGWTEKVTLIGASIYHEIHSDNPPANFTTEVASNNEITVLDSKYSLAFPMVGSEFYNPMPFYLNPSYTCGNNDCEASLGETTQNCCYDCACPAFQYCDVSVGCRSESLIVLELVGQQQTGITNCYFDHNINVHAKITGAPSGMTILNQSYKLGSQSEQIATCTESNGVYDCVVVVPAANPCTGTNYILGPNVLNFEVSYPNGTGTRTKKLTVSFPDITVGSWTCGQYGCEASLGEDDAKCCYDCPCTGPNEYCDFQPGDLSTTQCKPDLTSNDLQISNVDPLNFYTHTYGDSISFTAEIINKPDGLLTVTPNCSVNCVANSGLGCTASCSVSCSSIISNDASIYNSTCSMDLYIANYNVTDQYTLYPTLNYFIIYNNGTIQASNTLSNEFAAIIFDAHWCGDGTCNPDEDSSTCCYDCECLDGWYCDTPTISHASTGDVCKSITPIDVLIGQPTPTELPDSMYQGIVNVDVLVQNVPSGASLQPSCMLADGVVYCIVSCSNINATGDALCQITVPSMDYLDSSVAPYYDSSQDKIILPQNSLNISLVFPNGSSTTSMIFPFPLPDISINVTYHCGIDGCEANLGETVDNCCIDCGCQYPADQYCYTGTELAGQCLNSDELYLIFENTFPSDFGCTIAEHEGDCIFTRSLGVRTHVPNPPDDLQIVTTWYENRNKTWDANCMKLPNGSNYSCSLVLENLQGSSEGLLNIGIKLGFTVSYTVNNTRITQNLTTDFDVNVTREKSEYVKTCEAQLADMEDQLSDLKDDKKLIETILYVWMGIATALTICCYTPPCSAACSWCCIGAYWGWCILACVAGVLLPMLDEIKAEMESIKDQRAVACATNDFSGLSGSNGASSGLGNAMISTVLLIICVVCVLQGLGSGSPNGGQTGGAGGTVPPSTPSGAPIYNTPYYGPPASTWQTPMFV
jgi:hypothetical protein